MYSVVSIGACTYSRHVSVSVTFISEYEQKGCDNILLFRNLVLNWSFISNFAQKEMVYMYVHCSLVCA